VKKRRVSQQSVYQTEIRGLQDRQGEFKKDKHPWTKENDDQLLEGFLVGVWYFTHHDPHRKTFHGQCGRTPKAVTTRLWKLAANYREAADYTPAARTDRTGTPFTTRDFYLIEKALGEKGRTNGAHVPSHIALVLGRSETEVRGWLRNMVKKRPPLVTITTKETEDTRIAKIVHKMLDAFKNAIDVLRKELEDED
jgi:hypothetical protein